MKRFAYYLGYLLSLHIVALLLFFVFRLVLFCTIDYEFHPDIADDIPLQSIAFVRGVWFDNVIACYILILPLVICWVASLCNYTHRWVFRFSGIFMALLYSVSFGVAAANIPYFCYFFKNINSSIYNWFEHGTTTAGMVFGESSYYLPITLGIGAIILYWWITVRLSNIFYSCSTTNYSLPRSWKEIVATALLGAACIGLCLFGIRGRRGYNPIKVSQAYYCEDPFLNQLGVSPVFNLLTSTLDDMRTENRQLQLMPVEEAINNVQQLMKRNGIDNISPIARKVETQGVPTRKNVVMILMESMSAHLLQNFGQPKQLTPFLDSLYQQSCVYQNCYSAGIHTNHGMYATLYSFPAIMKRNAMKGSAIPVYSGLPTVLKENGYRNLFFMTHESQYDNMNAFFRTNGFDEIYAEENYPPEKKANSFGVQDDFLYEYALPILNERAKADEPFFCVLLSISNHPPYVIPEYFHPKSTKPEEQIVEYADWSIAQFMNEAHKQPWFNNTIFVLLGDHGKLVGTPDCEMPQSYNHVPFIIFGNGIQPEVRNDLCGQLDIAPTLLGMLNVSYVQNNFGIDLNKEQRSAIFYTADDMIAARDSSRFFIYSPEEQTTFYYEVGDDGSLKPAKQDEQLEQLKKYCFSMLQGAEYLVREQYTTDKPQNKNK